MRRLVLLAAMVVTVAGCGGSGSSSAPPGTIDLNGSKWVGAVTVSPANSVFANYSVRRMTLSQSGVKVFGSYSSSVATGGIVSGTVESYTVTFNAPPFITPAGCTGPLFSSGMGPSVVTNNSAGTDILSLAFTGTYLCNGTPYTETWSAILFRH